MVVMCKSRHGGVATPAGSILAERDVLCDRPGLFKGSLVALEPP